MHWLCKYCSIFKSSYFLRQMGNQGSKIHCWTLRMYTGVSKSRKFFETNGISGVGGGVEGGARSASADRETALKLLPIHLLSTREDGQRIASFSSARKHLDTWSGVLLTFYQICQEEKLLILSLLLFFWTTRYILAALVNLIEQLKLNKNIKRSIFSVILDIGRQVMCVFRDNPAHSEPVACLPFSLLVNHTQ